MDTGKLIEQFFEGTLTVDEEQALCTFLRENEVPASMQRDKEAVLAMCGYTFDRSLPAGAAQRLEAMLDELDSNSSPACTEERLPAAPVRRARKIPIFVRRVAAVAAVVAALFLVVRHGTHSTHNNSDWVAQERDTYSSPEEARACVQKAFGELAFAMNATRVSTKSIERTLEATAALHSVNVR